MQYALQTLPPASLIRHHVNLATVTTLQTLRPDLDLVINGDAMTLDVFDTSGACLLRYRLK